MKAYPEYKESGVDWINKIPSGWFISDFRRGIELLTDFEANGSFADVKKNVDLESDDNFAWYLRATDLEKGRIGIVDGNKTVDEKAYEFLSKTKLYGGELLVAKRGEIGKVYLTPKLDCKTTLAPNLYLIRLNRLINPEYSAYWFKSYYGQATLKLANKSTTIGALYKDDVKACPFVYPSAEEQLKIVSFLNFETSRIDNLIAEKENFINLLEEKQQALISHVVTKGLDDGVEMKDSGVEWVGFVPEHWRITRLKFITNKIGSGKTPTGGAESYKESGVLFLRSQNIYDNGLRLEDAVFIDDETHHEMRSSAVKKGDVLLNITGGSIGRTCLVDSDIGEANVNQHVCIIRVKDDVYREYLSLFMKSKVAKTQVDILQSGAGREGLNFEQIGNFIITLPTPSDVVAITSELNGIISKVNSLVDECINSINLLKERRAALISAAVTGKIDVREEV